MGSGWNAVEIKKGMRIQVMYKGVWLVGRVVGKGTPSFPYVDVSFRDNDKQWRMFSFQPGRYKEAREVTKKCVDYARIYCYNRIPDNEMCDRCVEERKGKRRAHYRPFRYSTSKRNVLKRAKRKRTIKDQNWSNSELKRKKPETYKKMFKDGEMNGK